MKNMTALMAQVASGGPMGAAIDAAKGLAVKFDQLSAKMDRLEAQQRQMNATLERIETCLRQSLLSNRAA